MTEASIKVERAAARRRVLLGGALVLLALGMLAAPSFGSGSRPSPSELWQAYPLKPGQRGSTTQAPTSPSGQAPATSGGQSTAPAQKPSAPATPLSPDKEGGGGGPSVAELALGALVVALVGAAGAALVMRRGRRARPAAAQASGPPEVAAAPRPAAGRERRAKQPKQRPPAVAEAAPPPVVATTTAPVAVRLEAEPTPPPPQVAPAPPSRPDPDPLRTPEAAPAPPRRAPDPPPVPETAPAAPEPARAHSPSRQLTNGRPPSSVKSPAAEPLVSVRPVEQREREPVEVGRAVWLCEIEWQSAGGQSSFVAVAFAKRGGRRLVLAESRRFRLTQMSDGSPRTVRELVHAVEALSDVLLEAGWRPVSPGRKWYARRFVWSGSGAPPQLAVPTEEVHDA